jgi:hypothetical protein
MATVIRPVVTMPAGVMRPLPLRLMFFPMRRSKLPSISSGCVIGTPGYRVAHLAFTPSRSTETWVRRVGSCCGALYLAEYSQADLTDGATKDVFVHISAVEKAGLSDLREGTKVSYDVTVRLAPVFALAVC